MEAKLPVTFLAVLAVAVAGCTGTPAEPVNPTDSPPPVVAPGTNITSPNATGPATNASGPVVQRFDGSVAGAGVAGGPKVTIVPLSENAFPFDLPNGTVAMVVELAWETSDTMELQLNIPGDYCTGNDPAGATANCNNPDPVEGSGPLKIVVKDPEQLAYVGTWTGAVFVGAPAPNAVPFTAYVSLFTDALPADSYTAIPPGA